MVFGKNYTQLLLVQPFFYAHDLLLLILSLISLLNYKYFNRIKSLEVLFIIIILYLLYSFIKPDFVSVQIVLRQFMIFGYGLLLYLIMNALFSLKKIREEVATYLAYFGIACLSIQILYVFYYLLLKGENPFFERNYFSPIIILGLFIIASFILVKIQNKYLKHILFLFVFLISFSTGHDSTYLSLALIYFSYLFILSSKTYKIILSMFLLIGVIMMFVFLPSFADVNVKWRLMFWKDSLSQITDNFLIFGDGFGLQYASDETILNLNNLFSNIPYGPQILGDDKYLCAPHNSFLTMAIHIGILSIILLFFPIKNLFYNKTLIMDKEILFLSLSLLGIVVFSSFNVILELPHSSSIFWIVFFSLIFKLSEKSESSSSKGEL